MTQDCDGTLTPEWAQWASMAATNVISHMNGGPLIPISYAFAAHVSGIKRAKLLAPRTKRRAHRPTSPEVIEANVIAGILSGMSNALIATNVGLTVSRVEEMALILATRGLVKDRR